MSAFIVDASVAIKWVIPEAGTDLALALAGASLAAPDLLVAECANALWRMARKGELDAAEAETAIRELERAELRLVPMRPYATRALELATELDHPAYDCFYLALAERSLVPLVTADERLVAKARAHPLRAVAKLALTLAEAAERL